jgi:hypothetical protein
MGFSASTLGGSNAGLRGELVTEIQSMLFAYISPETTLPVASALAAALGFFLMIARSPVSVAREGFRRAARGLRALIGKKRP